ETPGENQPRQRPASTRTAATAFHPGLRKAVAALPGLRSLAGVGGQPWRQPRLPGVSSVGWRQRRVCPDAPHRKSPARPGSNTSDTGNNVLPHKKRGGKLSGSSSRGLPRLGAGPFLPSALPRNAVGASVGWRRLASRREEASTQRERQRRQRVFADSFCVLFFGGGPW